MTVGLLRETTMTTTQIQARTGGIGPTTGSSRRWVNVAANVSLNIPVLYACDRFPSIHRSVTAVFPVFTLTRDETNDDDQDNQEGSKFHD